MFCAAYLATLMALEAVEVSGGFGEWLSRPVLTLTETQEQLARFVKKRVPPAEPSLPPDEWKAYLDRCRRDVLDKVIFRGVPGEWLAANLGLEWLDVVETGKGYRIRKLRYEAVPGLWLSGLLYEPESLTGCVPAILNVNGHELDEGKAKGYEQVRCINLAKRGMLALHPEWINCGELHKAGYEHNRLAYLDLCGTSGVSVFYLAMRRALDILLAHPFADPERVAMTGLSGGGWQTILLSALDTRIKLAAPNAGYIGLAVRTEFPRDIGDREQVPVDLVTIADYTHLTAMMAPRPALLLYNEKDDCCFEAWRAKPSVYEPIIPFFAWLGDENDFQFHENKFPGTHNYERDNREQFYRFVNRYFLAEGPRVDEDIDCADEVLSQEALEAGLPDNNATFVSLAERLLEGLPKTAPPETSAALEDWRKETERGLRETLRLKPADAEASVVREESSGFYRATWYKLSISGEWTIPAVALEDTRAAPASTALLIADGGKKGMEGTAVSLLEQGTRVVLVDPFLIGECAVTPQFAMLVETVGERCLGIQVQQIGAVIRWACRAFQSSQVALYADGWNATAAALAAGALEKNCVRQITARNAIESLRNLIAQRTEPESCPALFCFGLLQCADIEDLKALCAPVPVEMGFGESAPRDTSS